MAPFLIFLVLFALRSMQESITSDEAEEGSGNFCVRERHAVRSFQKFCE